MIYGAVKPLSVAYAKCATLGQTISSILHAIRRDDAPKSYS